MTGPSPRRLLAEAAQLAHHFHWTLDSILDLEHRDRRLFLDEAAVLAVPSGGASSSHPDR
jgi:hypothetical protein